jgi:NADH-quinone oxidoreductase subunit C
MTVTKENIVNALQTTFVDAILKVEDGIDMLTLTIAAPEALNIIRYLYEDAQLQFQYLTDLTGAHYPDNKGGELVVIYHLHNLRANVRIRLKAFLPIERPEIPSLTSLYAGSNWMERETYDFFGIHFTGHPNLKRILNAEEMDYFPMRKEYPMEDPTRLDKDDDMFGR